jgi:hypothetical protein
MNCATLRLSVAGVLTLSLAHAPAPTAPAFDPAKMRAEFAAFNQKPDTVGTGKYPALKEMVDSLPNHVIYRPRDLTKLGKEKLGVLAWGNGGCAADGAGGAMTTLSVVLAQRLEAHPAFIGLIAMSIPTAIGSNHTAETVRTEICTETFKGLVLNPAGGRSSPPSRRTPGRFAGRIRFPA